MRKSVASTPHKMMMMKMTFVILSLLTGDCPLLFLLSSNDSGFGEDRKSKTVFPRPCRETKKRVEEDEEKKSFVLCFLKNLFKKEIVIIHI